MSDMSNAIRGMIEHSTKAAFTDRRDWSDEQWIADAKALMDDLDGSIMSLVNGHVMALIRFHDCATPPSEPRDPAAVGDDEEETL